MSQPQVLGNGVRNYNKTSLGCRKFGRNSFMKELSRITSHSVGQRTNSAARFVRGRRAGFNVGGLEAAPFTRASGN